jgi:hypothetical protein
MGRSSISNRHYTLSSPKLAGCPEADIATRCFPLKHDDGFEASITSVAAIDLELLRLNGNLIFPGWGDLIGLDKLDVGIRVIDPDRGRAPAFTCLFDTERGLVILRVCGTYPRTAGADSRAPSFAVMETVGMRIIPFTPESYDQIHSAPISPLRPLSLVQ